MACRFGCLARVKLERTQRGKRRAHGDRRALPSFVTSASSGVNRSGNGREEPEAAAVEAMVLMKGLTMLRAQSYQPYAIRVIAAAEYFGMSRARDAC